MITSIQGTPGYDPAIDPAQVALGLSAGDMALLTKLYGGVLAQELEATRS